MGGLMFHVVAHVTILLVLAFFILFAAEKADGFVKLLGTVLGWWLIIVAVLIVVACVTRPMFGGKPFGIDIHAMHGTWVHPDEQPASPAPAKPGGH